MSVVDAASSARARARRAVVATCALASALGALGVTMHALTREEQTAIRLIVCQGLDYQAAARSLGVPV